MSKELVSDSEMDNYRSMLDELMALESGLTPEEIEFLDSLYNWIGCFTLKQANWLQKIYDNVI